jgi:hypothetical protein
MIILMGSIHFPIWVKCYTYHDLSYFSEVCELTNYLSFFCIWYISLWCVRTCMDVDRPIKSSNLGSPSRKKKIEQKSSIRPWGMHIDNIWSSWRARSWFFKPESMHTSPRNYHRKKLLHRHPMPEKTTEEGWACPAMHRPTVAPSLIPAVMKWRMVTGEVCCNQINMC